jgi:hypothetical protein
MSLETRLAGGLPSTGLGNARGKRAGGSRFRHRRLAPFRTRHRNSSCWVIAEHRCFWSKSRDGVLPIDHIVRRALAANHIVVLVCALLCEICEPATGIRKETPERTEDRLGGKALGPQAISRVEVLNFRECAVGRIRGWRRSRRLRTVGS